MYAAYLIEFIPFPFHLWNIKVFIDDNNVQAGQLKINQTKKKTHSTLFHHPMLPFLKKKMLRMPKLFFRRKGKQEGTCHLKRPVKDEELMNVLKSRHEMWFLLGRHVNLYFWEMTPRRSKEATGNTRALVLVALPRNWTRWPHKHYGKSLLNRSFLFQKRTRGVWMHHSKRKDLKISTLGLDFGTPCWLWDTTTWGPTVGNTCLQTLLLVFFFFWVCGRGLVQALWTAEHELWIFGEQGCISDLLFWPSHWELQHFFQNCLHHSLL